MADELKSWAIPEERLKRGYTAGELFVRLKLVPDTAALEALIGAKKATVNGSPVTSLDQSIGHGDLKGGKIDLVAGTEAGVIEAAVME